MRNSIERQAQTISQSLDRDQHVPLWLWLKASESGVNIHQPVIFDLRMLRADRYQLWLVPEDTALTPRNITNTVVQGEGGLLIDLPSVGFTYDIVGEIHSPYGWKPDISAWQGVSVTQLQKKFTKTGSSLYVVFLTLAAISLCIALVTRSRLFVIFSGWLVASIMITGFNYGWDFSWLGIAFTGQGLSMGLMTITLSAYGFLSGYLFLCIFAQQLKGSKIRTALHFCIAGFVVIAVVGAFAPLSVFMALIWGNGLFGIACIALGLVQAIGRGSRLTAWLYASSYAFLVSGVAAEILYQLGMLPELRGLISAAGSSIASAIVMSVTLAVQLRDERAARQLARQGEIEALMRLEGVYERSPVGLFSLNTAGQLISSNRAFKKLFASENQNNEKPTFDSLCDAGLRDACRQASAQGIEQRREICLTRNDQNPLWLTIRLAAGEYGYDGSVADVSWRKQAEQRLSYLATNDAVTGALNQHGLNTALQERLHDKHGTVFGLIAFDQFAYVLRTHGFDVGDKLLGILIKEIELALPTAVTARVGEKIYLLLEDGTPDATKAALENRFSKLTDSGVAIGDKILPASFTAGLCLLEGCRSVTDAMTRAKLAYEKAVEEGTTCALIGDDQSIEAIRHLDTVRAQHKPGTLPDMGRFFLVAQPIINLQSLNASVSFELLLRMRGQNGEVISPAHFLPAAEKVGLMSTLDHFVFTEVIRLVESGELPIYRIEHVSINLSGSSLNDPHFLDDFYHQVARCKVDAAHFCFEITESVALNSFNQTKAFLSALRALGAHTAIDDFGAGHSSIHYLSELAPDYLKLDGSLVRNMLAKPVHHSYLDKIVQLASEIEVQCIAEFVESQPCHDALADMGVKYAQGYLYSQPIEIDAAADFCKQWQTLHAATTH